MAGGKAQLLIVAAGIAGASLLFGVGTGTASLAPEEFNAQQQVELGNDLFAEHDVDAAAAAYRKAITIDQNAQWTHHQLGRIHFSKNELNKALIEFNHELLLHEDSVNSYYMRGLTYAFLEDLEKAEVDFREFVKRKPGSEAGLNDLAYVLFLQNKFEGSNAVLRELLAEQPSSFLAQQGLAAVLIEMGRFKEAEVFGAQALEFAEGMDAEVFEAYYPSLNPEHAQKGLETIQRGIRHNINLIASLQEGTFEVDETTPAILKPYFATASGGKYGAVFLAASCEAGYEHPESTSCDSNSSIVSPSAGSWRTGSFSVGVIDSAPSGTELSTCWQTAPDLAQRTCSSNFTVSAGSGGSCSTQGSNTCTVTVDACTRQAGGGTSFGCGGADSRSFSIDYTNPSVGTVSPTSATAGSAVTFSASVSDSHSGISGCYLYVDGSFQGSMNVSGGTASRSHTFASSGTFPVYAWCADNASNSASGTPVNVSVAEPPPALSVTPTGSQSYGNVPVGHYGTIIFSVSNTGGGTLSGSITGLAPPFSCLSCSYSVSGGSSVDKWIYFDPTSTVSSSDTAIFSGGGSTSRALSGSGVDWGLQISASPSSSVGNGVGVTLTATTSYTVGGTSLYMRIYDGSTQIASCGTGTSCSSPVQTFSGTTKTYTAKVENFGATEVWDTASQNVTWANPAQISVTPSSLSFGTIGTNSWTYQTFTVTNTGNGTVTGSVSGLAAPFSCSSGCSYSVAGGGNHTTTIRFEPTAVTSYSDTAVFSGEGGPLNRGVSGSGGSWIAGISSSPTSPVLNGTSVTLSATSNHNITPSSYWLRIYQSPNTYPNYVKSCVVSLCEQAVSASDTTRTYIARIENGDGSTVLSSDSTSVTWGSRDLVVQSITPSPANPVAGETITYTVSVRNQGALDSTGGFVSGYTSNPPSCPPSPTGYFGFKSLGTVPAGVTQQYTVTLTNGFSTAGTKTVWMYADDTCSVSESNETNNESTDIVTVGATQFPSADFTFEPTTFVTGQSTIVRGWLKDADGGGVGGKTVALQCWNGTGWPQVATGVTEPSNPGSIGYTAFNWTPDSGWQGDISCRLQFAGDSSWLTSTSVTKQITVNPPCTGPVALSATPSQIYAGDTVTLTASGLNSSCDGKTLYFGRAFEVGTPTQTDPPWTGGGSLPAPVQSCVVSGGGCTAQDVPLPASHTDPWPTYMTYNAQVDLDGDGEPQAGEISSPAQTVMRNTCLKMPTAPTETATINLSNGKVCNINIVPKGADITDSSSITHEVVDPLGSYNVQIGMSDDPPSCGNDLRWDVAWWPETLDKLLIGGVVRNYSATHLLQYGFEVSSPNCVFTGTPVKTCTATNCNQTINATYINDRTYSSNTIKGSGAATSTDGFETDFTLKQCTLNSHCTTASDAVAAAQKCNLNAAVTYAPQNTCIDSVAPTSTVEGESNFAPVPGLRPSDNKRWLKSGTYTIDVTDVDDGNTTASGLSSTTSCSYWVFDEGAGGGLGAMTVEGANRTCGTLTLTVGPPGSGANCGNESGESRCIIYADSVDRAGNSYFHPGRVLHIDTILPGG